MLVWLVVIAGLGWGRVLDGQAIVLTPLLGGVEVCPDQGPSATDFAGGRAGGRVPAAAAAPNPAGSAA